MKCRRKRGIGLVLFCLAWQGTSHGQTQTKPHSGLVFPHRARFQQEILGDAKEFSNVIKVEPHIVIQGEEYDINLTKPSCEPPEWTNATVSTGPLAGIFIARTQLLAPCRFMFHVSVFEDAPLGTAMMDLKGGIGGITIDTFSLLVAPPNYNGPILIARGNHPEEG